MKKQLIFFAIGLILLSSMSRVLGHAGTDTSESSGGLLTLEQIYIITVFMAIFLAFILENRGIVKHRSFVYKLIGFGLIFLTADFIIYRDYLA